jgi:hypothetical protein
MLLSPYSGRKNQMREIRPMAKTKNFEYEISPLQSNLQCYIAQNWKLMRTNTNRFISMWPYTVVMIMLRKRSNRTYCKRAHNDSS